MKRHTSKEELEFCKQLFNNQEQEKLLFFMRDQFNVLQVRSQMLLSLIVICFTITGFSGPAIAASNSFSKISIGIGLFLVLLSAVLLVLGPLKLQWLTFAKKENFENTIIELIERRNRRTKLYSLAVYLLIFGISSYVLSLLGYLIIVESLIK